MATEMVSDLQVAGERRIVPLCAIPPAEMVVTPLKAIDNIAGIEMAAVTIAGQIQQGHPGGAR
jgi:hypothetical protein